jgi:hypothetical protein
MLGVMAVKDRSAHELEEALDRLEKRLRDAEEELRSSRELAARFASVAEREGEPGELEQWLLSALRDDDALSAVDLAKYLVQSGPAFQTFVTTVAELLGTRPLSEEAARRAALVAVSQEVWENELGAMLSSAQIRELLGGVSRQRVDEMLRARRLVGLLDASGRRRYPAFQFHNGRPLTDLIDAFWLLADPVSDWTAASWCTSPEPALDDLTPAQFAAAGGDRDRLLLIAQRDSARLAQ